MWTSFVVTWLFVSMQGATYINRLDILRSIFNVVSLQTLLLYCQMITSTFSTHVNLSLTVVGCKLQSHCSWVREIFGNFCHSINFDKYPLCVWSFSSWKGCCPLLGLSASSDMWYKILAGVENHEYIAPQTSRSSKHAASAAQQLFTSLTSFF